MRSCWAIAAMLGALVISGPARAQDEANREKALGIQQQQATQKAWAVDPYWQPISYLQGEFISGPSWSGQTPFSIQIVGGMGGGVHYRENATLGKSGLHLFGYSRGAGIVRYGIIVLDGAGGIGQGGYGLAGKVGSFFGVDGKWFRATTGPDFWADLYQGGSDYQLPISPGIDWRTEAYFKFTRDFWLRAEVSPGWAFAKSRRRQGVLDQLEIRGSLQYFGEFQGAIGWRVEWNSAGHQNGPFIEAYFK